MARRVAPVVQGRNGKANKKIKGFSDIRSQSRGAVSSSDSASSPAPTHEIVGMSLTPALLERLEKSLLHVPDVDSPRVDEIKKALESGSLQINADDIADAMIRLDRSLGG